MMRRFRSILLFSILFVVGFTLMGYEMLGSRYLNPYFGGGITTWACLISVVLMSMMIGYAGGGFIADNVQGSFFLTGVFFLVGVYLLLVAFLGKDAMLFIMNKFGYDFSGTMLAASVLTVIPVGFLASVSPFFVKLILSEISHTGRVTGSVYAVSTFGNVFGTLITTFWLIPNIGTRNITLLLGGILLLCACVTWLIRERVSP
ncbi:MAG: fused MFS/spermidine synthase [Mangrovicoccus sp.]